MSIEENIQEKGLIAPRITTADIEANIATVNCFTAADGVLGAYKNNNDVYVGDRVTESSKVPLSLLTICVMVLKNGFTVTGESACASPENFDAEIGRYIARKNAIEKIRTLMEYELKSSLLK